MIPMASVASGAPPDEVGNPYTCQAHRVGTFWCQCLACAAAEMQARGYGELHGAELRRALAANRDTIVTNGASGVFDGALAFEQDGRLMILYALTCGRSGAISADMKFVRHHERTAWLVARARVANREVTRGGQLRPTTAARDRGARSTRSTRATRTAWSVASGSSSPSPGGPGSSRSGTESALAESDPDPDGVRVSHTWRPRALSGLSAGVMCGEAS